MAAPKSGLSAQFMYAAETTWGVYKAPTVSQRLISETLTRQDERLESKGIIAGRRVRSSDQWAIGRTKCGGGVQFELTNKDIAVLVSHMMGAASTPYTPGDLYGYGLTLQVGVPDINGTVQPKSYVGSKIAKWQLGCAVGEIATFGIDVVAAREVLVRVVTDGATNTNTTVTSVTAAFTNDDIGKPISGTNIPANTTISAVASATSVTISQAATGTGTGLTLTIGAALGTVSYTAATKPVTFVQGSLTVASSSVSVKKATLSGDNGLDVDRFFLGSQELSEPIEANLRAYTLALEVEFANLTQYRRYINASEVACVLTFTGPGTFSMVITTNVRLDGDTAQISGPGLTMQTLPMVCIGPTTDAGAISIALTEAS